MKKGLKTILIVVGILVLAIVVYSVFFNKSEDTSNGLVSVNTSQPVSSLTPNVSTGVEIGQEFISMLLSLQGLSLDTVLFQDPAFNSLVDKTIQFRDPGGQGRPNPFAPIGTDVVSQPEEPANEDQGGDTTPPADESNGGSDNTDPFGGDAGFDPDSDA